jgi:hypothetical protein
MMSAELTWRWRRSAVVVGRSLLVCAWDTALLLLLVVGVIHPCIGLVASVCGVWVLSVLLVVLGICLSVVRRGSSTGSSSAIVGCCGRSSTSIASTITASTVASVSGSIPSASVSAAVAVVAITVSSVATTVSTIIAATVVITTAATASTTTRTALLELLVLGADVGQEIKTEFFGTENLVGVRTAVIGQCLNQ